MHIVEELMQTHPWRTLAGAFLVGGGLAFDRRMRRSLVLSGLQIARAIAVEYAKRYAHAWAAAEPTTYARA